VLEDLRLLDLLLQAAGFLGEAFLRLLVGVEGLPQPGRPIALIGRLLMQFLSAVEGRVLALLEPFEAVGDLG